ncbi:MAG: hypothetical protein DBX97_04235 [Collinsella tanakaei]|nr:MAG: hypothetical protein DBX97_04235 [Collinsella tanakaei]
MSELVMLVGLPASGKTTYAEGLKAKGFHIHSSDKIRKELYGDVNVQDKNVEVFSELHKRIKNDLQNGISCVYDATNMSMKRRIAFLGEIKKYDCKKICVLFVVPIEVCKERNQNRERKVPEDVFDKMLKQFQCPYYYEDWDEIKINWYDGKVKPVKVDWDMSQDNSHHTLTVGDHMRMAMGYIFGKYPKNYRIAIAAGLHDIGKFYTKKFIDSKGNPSEEAHYYGHENYGAYMFLINQNSAVSNGDYECAKTDELEQKNNLYIACLINWHMRPHTAWKESEKARERDHKLVGERMYQDIMLLHEADLAAH